MQNPFNHPGLSTSLARALPLALTCGFLTMPIQGADVEPLRSADLEARLTASGFDDAQRARVLADHGAYVERFTALAAERLAEWQGIARSNPATIEDARTLANRARAAAQAIDDAELPLIESIRASARPEQVAAVATLVTLLEIRRDLAFASVVRESVFGGRNSNLLDVVGSVKLSSEVLAQLKPRLDQYLLEHQVAVRRIRDASFNVPLRRVEARLKHVDPPQPVVDPGNIGLEWFSRWNEEKQAVRQARMNDANAERTAARVKSIELDTRTLESIMPALGGREQGELLTRWWFDAGIFSHGKGQSSPNALSRAWSKKDNRITPEVGVALDAICAAWVAQWWPRAKELAIESTGNSSLSFVFNDSKDDEESKKDERMKDERIAAATKRAVEAIAFAVEGKVAETAQGSGDQSQLAQTAEGTQVFSTIAVVGGNFGEIQFVAGSIDLGEVVMQLEEGVGFDGAVSIELGGGFEQKSPLPTLMVQFDELKPVLAASGVDATMMAVAEQAVADMLAEAQVIVQEAQAMQGSGQEMFGGFLEIGADGQPKPIDSAERERRMAQGEWLRGRLLSLESERLADLLSVVVPESGRPCVSWLAPWRQFESERAATMGFDPFSGPQLDPTRAVRGAQLTREDWIAIGPDLAATCADLASRIHLVAAMMSKARAAEPTPVFTTDGSGDQQWVDDGSSADFIKLQVEARRLAQAARTAMIDSVPRLRSKLQAGSAQRFQDAWDDQVFARDLKDPTNLASRFVSALALTLEDGVRGQVIVMQSSWTNASRTIRDRIVAIKSKALAQGGAQNQSPEAEKAKASEAAESRAAVQALSFERDELNRRVFRELVAALGEELGAKVAPLPKGKGNKMGIGAAMGAMTPSFSFTTSPAGDAAP